MLGDCFAALATSAMDRTLRGAAGDAAIPQRPTRARPQSAKKVPDTFSPGSPLSSPRGPLLECPSSEVLPVQRTVVECHREKSLSEIPEFLAVGHVTHDHVESGKVRLGGAALYSSLTAQPIGQEGGHPHLLRGRLRRPGGDRRHRRKGGSGIPGPRASGMSTTRVAGSSSCTKRLPP